LLRHGAAVNPGDRLGRTALMSVTDAGADNVDLLLGHGANPEARDTFGCTALTWAAGRGYGAVVRRLLKRGTRMGLLDAIYLRDEPAALRIIGRGVEPNRRGVEGETPLEAAGER